MITTATTSIPTLPTKETDDVDILNRQYIHNHNVYMHRPSSSTNTSTSSTFRILKSIQTFKATSCFTVVLFICLETVLLSTVSNCAKTFYMHWNTTNSM